MFLIKQNQYILVVPNLTFEKVDFQTAEQMARDIKVGELTNFRFPRPEELEIIRNHMSEPPFDQFTYWCLSNELLENDGFITDFDAPTKKMVFKEEAHALYPVKVILESQLDKLQLSKMVTMFEEKDFKSGKRIVKRNIFPKKHTVATATEIMV